MVRPPSFDTNGIKKGAWSEEEDNRLRAFIHRHGHPPNWRLLPILAGLARCGKSCRLRWVNYLQPGLKKGNFSKEEEDLIIKLHTQLGTKWSVIAERFPGRTDNDIKNYWHAHIKKRGKRNRVPTGTTTTADDRTKQEQHESSEVTNCMNNNHEEVIVSNQGLYVEKPMIDGDHAYMVGQTHCNDDLWAEAYDNICFGQLSVDLPLLEEEFFDFGVSTFSDSSEGGITPSGSTSGESQESFWSRMSYEDDTVDMVLW